MTTPTASAISLKVMFMVHLILSGWATMKGGFLPDSYIYMNAFMLAFGALAIVLQEGSEALLMFFMTNVSFILTDIIFLGVYAGNNLMIAGNPSLYRFSLSMAIINLLVRPVSCFITYRLYQERIGQYSDFGIPNIPGLPNFNTASSPGSGGYENIDQPVPTNNIETATPHSTIDKSPGIP